MRLMLKDRMKFLFHSLLGVTAACASYKAIEKVGAQTLFAD